MIYTIEPWHDGNPNRAMLVLKCSKSLTGECHLALRKDLPVKTPPAWHWDGDKTITPSIHCSICGFHKTLIKGIWK